MGAEGPRFKSGRPDQLLLGPARETWVTENDGLAFAKFLRRCRRPLAPPRAAVGLAKRLAALGKALVHANEKPVSELQKRILVG